MTATKERIIGAVSLMNDKEAEFFWKMIQSRLTQVPLRKCNPYPGRSGNIC